MILTKHVRVRVTGQLGRITLDRPEAINALTQSMIEEIDFALDRFARDPRVATVVLDGAGDRGFCAGGDVVALRESALEDGCAALRFWRSEYRLNARIAAFPKPVVAIMDGVVMGGGVGLAGHARHRVATGRLAWAMPEVRIGFSPDVGGTYLLSRLPGELGTWIALTARRLGAAEALALGLVDYVVDHEEVEPLIERLAVEAAEKVLGPRRGGADDDANLSLSGGRADDDAAPGPRRGGAGNGAAVDLHGGGTDDGAAPGPRRAEAGEPVGAAGDQRQRIDEWFAGDDAAVIERRLEAAGPVARPLLDELRLGSPTSVAVTLAALRQARRLADLEQCLDAEFRTSSSFLEVEDFREGIRAVLVDKEGAPRWRPDSLEAIDPGRVADILAGPADLEPLWGDADPGGSGSWNSA